VRVSEEPFICAEAIQRRVCELAAEIRADFGGAPLTLVVVLKGSVIFAADLMRALDGDVAVEFIRARSYVGAHSSGVVSFDQLPDDTIEGRHVLVVEDILDTGRTCLAVFERLRARRPASMKLCVLLDKPSRRAVAVAADYVGFMIEDRFVVGYGLDYNEAYRNLPAIYLVEGA
jgi:hypoxanthine phosphoribosyltransferase